MKNSSCPIDFVPNILISGADVISKQF